MNTCKEYEELIKKAQLQNRTKKNGIFHAHHIKPKSLFPELKDEKDNIVLLTPAEHFQAHYLLWKMNQNEPALVKAFYVMSHVNKKQIDKDEYQFLCEQESQLMSVQNRGKNNPMFGKNPFKEKTDEEMKTISKKISNKLKGLKRGIATYDKDTLKVSFKFKEELNENDIIGFPPVKEESKIKMSESAKKRGTPKCAFRNKSGKNNPMFNKHHNEETKQKIRETKQKKQKECISYGLLGKKAYYHKDTLKIKYFFPNDEIPSEYIKGRPPKKNAK